MMVSAEEFENLELAARRAAANSYSPYSGFAVGAAVLAGSGNVFAGCNVENASLGLTVCAERHAVAAAVTAGERRIRAMLIYSSTRRPVLPCGACRQVLREFADDLPVISVCEGEERRETTLKDLLPRSFGPDDLDVSGESP